MTRGHARAKSAEKRGGDFQRVCLTATGATDGDDPLELMLVNDLLEQLNELNPRQARIVGERAIIGQQDLLYSSFLVRVHFQNDIRC